MAEQDEQTIDEIVSAVEVQDFALAGWILDTIRADAIRDAALHAQQGFVDEMGGVGFARTRTDWLLAYADKLDPRVAS